MVFFVLFSSFLALFFFYHFYWKRRNLPPGPIPLPFIGHVHLMQKYEPGYELWRMLAREYGPVATFWMAEVPIVSISDYNIIKETIIKDGGNYVGRPVFPLSVVLRGGSFGIVESSGNLWLQQRRFALHVLRNFGMGQNLMEEKVLNQARIFNENLEKDRINGPVDLQEHFDVAVGSIINTVLVGYAFDESNISQFKYLKKLLNDQMERSAWPSSGIITVFPSLKGLPILRDTYKVASDNFQALFSFFANQRTEHEKTIDYESDDYSDYMEAFLKERKKNEHLEDFGGYGLPQLYNVCFDLWLAGMETTSNTLYWAVLYTLVNPEAHRKVVEELDSVINSTRPIDMSDKNKLNYINATLCEVQRLANLLPMNLARTADHDVTVGKYTVPAGTLIIPQISAVMYDERVFPDPYKFDPSRFLDESGNVKRIDEFVPFSVGKRQCLGEGLAKMELFIFYANFFNQYKVSVDPANPSPSTHKKFSFTVKAHNYTVLLEPRK